MQTVAVGWQIYSITHRALDLGYVGLAQFLPGILLFLVSGHVADKFNRLKLMIACLVGFAMCSLLLLISSLRDYQSIGPIYAVIVLLGVVRVVQRAGGAGVAAAAGAGKTFSECGGLAFDDFSGGDDFGAVAGRNYLCGVSRAFGGVCEFAGVRVDCGVLYYAGATAADGAAAGSRSI